MIFPQAVQWENLFQTVTGFYEDISLIGTDNSFFMYSGDICAYSNRHIQVSDWKVSIPPVDEPNKMP